LQPVGLRTRHASRFKAGNLYARCHPYFRAFPQNREKPFPRRNRLKSQDRADREPKRRRTCDGENYPNGATADEPFTCLTKARPEPQSEKPGSPYLSPPRPSGERGGGEGDCGRKRARPVALPAAVRIRRKRYMNLPR
jgi:hypothetical protein